MGLRYWPRITSGLNISTQIDSARIRQQAKVQILTFLSSKGKEDGSGRSGHMFIYPLLTCVSLGRLGPLHSFSEWEKLLQIRYTTQSVVCALMWQLVSIHISHMLTPPSSITSTEGATWQFLSERDYTGYDIDGVQPNPLKYVRHCKLPKRQTSRVSYNTFFLSLNPADPQGIT